MLVLRNILYQQQRIVEAIQKKRFDGRYVAMFHQIEDDVEKWYDDKYAISFSCFKDYIYKLRKNGFQIVSPYEILINDGIKKVVLTFDDVFENLYCQIYPYLKEESIPFVVFPSICKLEEKGYLNKEMLCEMVKEYPMCYVGAHSLSHSNLRSLGFDKCREEIINSGKVLETIIKKDIDIFAYPYGSYDAVSKRERKIAGEKYKLAFGTIQCGVIKGVDRMYVPRININDSNYQKILHEWG